MNILYALLNCDKHIEYRDNVRNGLQNAGYQFAMAEISYVPQTTVTLTDETDIKNMNKLIDLLEDSDDVQEVYHNWEEPEEE